MNTYHISIREIADWDDCPHTAQPVTIEQAREMSRFYNCKLWLQTMVGEYIGTVVNGICRRAIADSEITWRASFWGSPEAHKLA